MKNPSSSGTVRMEADAYNGVSFVCNGYSSFLISPFTSYARGSFCTTGQANKDLGNTTYKWGNLYMTGNISDGTNTISMSDLAAVVAFVKSIMTMADNDASRVLVGKEDRSGVVGQLPDNFIQNTILGRLLAATGYSASSSQVLSHSTDPTSEDITWISR